MSKKIAKWIILSYTKQLPEFVCERCGERRVAHIPAVITDFIKQGEAFSASHRFCREFTTEPPKGARG